MNQSKTVGYILIGIAAVIVVLGAAWALTGELNAQGRVLAIIFALIPAAVLAGFGVYTLNKGTVESGEEVVIRRQQKLLSMVQTQGKVDIASASIELKTSRADVQQLVRDLVGKQLFSG